MSTLEVPLALLGRIVSYVNTDHCGDRPLGQVAVAYSVYVLFANAGSAAVVCVCWVCGWHEPPVLTSAQLS